MIVQELKADDYEKRRRFSEIMLEFPEERLILTSDEAHFHLNGCVNKQNFRYWGPQNPKQIHERPLRSPKVTVWCAVCRLIILRPYFFEDNGRNVTVNSVRYVTMLTDLMYRSNTSWWFLFSCRRCRSKVFYPFKIVLRQGIWPWRPTLK